MKDLERAIVDCVDTWTFITGLYIKIYSRDIFSQDIFVWGYFTLGYFRSRIFLCRIFTRIFKVRDIFVGDIYARHAFFSNRLYGTNKVLKIAFTFYSSVDTQNK